jgi:hypothetical protein
MKANNTLIVDMFLHVRHVGGHERKPAVERLYFHLLGEHSIYISDDDHIDDVLLKRNVTESMFTAWLEANKKYAEARTLTYSQFDGKFVYVKKKRLCRSE